MAKFIRKKPVEIEAIQISNNAEEVQSFIGDKGNAIETEHGTLVSLDCGGALMAGTNGAYIIKDYIDGSFSIYDKNTFETIFEKVN